MRLVTLLAGALMLFLLAAPAIAQPQERPGRGARQRQQQLSPEKAEAAWTWQAKGVAREMSLSDDQVSKLVGAFVQNRKDFNRAMRDMAGQGRGGRGGQGGAAAGGGRGGEGGGRGGRGGGLAMNPELMAKQRAGLEKSLASFLTADQAKRAAASLGMYSRQWDSMVVALDGMGLEQEQMYAALTPVRTYAMEVHELRESGDREVMRDGMRAAREGLATSLGKVLNDEQMKQFQEATSRRRGGEGGGRGRGGAEGPGDGPNVATIGQPAPVFTLEDAGGTAHSLADFAGRIVVLQWINPDCPVCRGVTSSGKVAKMKRELESTSGDIVVLAVNSTHYMEPAVSAAYLKSHELDMPALIDRDGKVGHLYGAKTTPHVFVIDAEGVLRYEGAFDDDASRRKGDDATNYAVQAVRQIVAKETVVPSSTKSYGCSVKYAK